MGPIWISCVEISLPDSMPPRAIATDGPLHQSRFGRWVQSIVSVVLLLGLSSSVVRGQAQPTSQLFTVLEKDKLLDQTPAQSDRLASLRKLPTTKSVTVVRINPAALSSNQLGLLLPGVNTLHALRTGGDMRDSRDFTWTGTLEDGQRGGTTLIIRNSEVTGSISTPTGLYRISPLGGGVHALVEIDPTKFPKDEPESFRSKESRQVQFTSSPGTSEGRDRADSAPDLPPFSARVIIRHPVCRRYRG
jgi:hypothetical protein